MGPNVEGCGVVGVLAAPSTCCSAWCYEIIEMPGTSGGESCWWVWLVLDSLWLRYYLSLPICPNGRVYTGRIGSGDDGLGSLIKEA